MHSCFDKWKFIKSCFKGIFFSLWNSLMCSHSLHCHTILPKGISSNSCKRNNQSRELIFLNWQKYGNNFWNCLKSMDIERQCYLIHFLISRQPSDQIQGGTVYYIIFFLGKLELNFMLCNRGVFHGSCWISRTFDRKRGKFRTKH